MTVAAMTAVEIAEQAGVDVRYVEDLAERGILSRDGGFVASDSRRVGVVQALE